MKTQIKIALLAVLLVTTGFATAQITNTDTPTTDRFSDTTYTNNNDNDDDSGKWGLLGLLGPIGLLGLLRNRRRDDHDYNRTTTTR